MDTTTKGRAGLEGHDLGDAAPVHPPGLAVDDDQLAVEPVDRAEAVIAAGERLAEGRTPSKPPSSSTCASWSWWVTSAAAQSRASASGRPAGTLDG